ncbi:MAG: phage holin family protein [Betaproteobacteria bacterium]|nr:phage holin family protein [Betaproteobacteria bacterium]
MRLVLVWMINAAALFALPYIFKSIQIDSFTTALIVALILSILNTIVRPILFLLTLPITILTLGLFIFVLNGLMLWFAASFIDGFFIAGFWPAVFGAIVYSVISWAAASFILGDKKKSS